MHAQYVRVWFVAGLFALVAAIPMAVAGLPAHATLLLLGVAYLTLAISLGLLPAFARRDWPAPVHALAGVTLGALALPFAWQERPFTALAGASLLVGALQPLALLLSPRWNAPADQATYRVTDRVALGGLVLSLLSVAAAGILLIALPRGLPNAAFAALLCGGALPAALAALLFVLPREARAPLPLALVGAAALVFLGLAALALTLSLLFPFRVEARGAVAGVAVGLGLATVALMRAPRRPPLAAASLALAVLASLGLLFATLYGAPNELLPAAFYAFVALDLVLLASALVAAAPLLLPGRADGRRWPRWAPALLIAALFLYTPALQLGRATAPALLVGALGVVVLVAGLAPLARATRAL